MLLNLSCLKNAGMGCKNQLLSGSTVDDKIPRLAGTHLTSWKSITAMEEVAGKVSQRAKLIWSKRYEKVLMGVNLSSGFANTGKAEFHNGFNFIKNIGTSSPPPADQEKCFKLCVGKSKSH